MGTSAIGGDSRVRSDSLPLKRRLLCPFELHPRLVVPLGIEPRLHAHRARVLPLDDGTVKWWAAGRIARHAPTKGAGLQPADGTSHPYVAARELVPRDWIEQSFPVYRTGVLPLNEHGELAVWRIFEIHAGEGTLGLANRYGTLAVCAHRIWRKAGSVDLQSLPGSIGFQDRGRGRPA